MLLCNTSVCSSERTTMSRVLFPPPWNFDACFFEEVMKGFKSKAEKPDWNWLLWASCLPNTDWGFKKERQEREVFVGIVLLLISLVKAVVYTENVKNNNNKSIFNGDNFFGGKLFLIVCAVLSEVLYSCKMQVCRSVSWVGQILSQNKHW